MDNNFLFASASISDRGLSEKRPVNEDSFLDLSSLGLFAVADGVGGAQAGDFASQMAMETLSEAFHNLPENFDAEQALRVAIEHANQSIHTMSSELPQLASMATTIAALHLNGNIATVAHVGDSRVYRIEPDGTLKRETADHSVVEEEVRAGRMTPEEALVHPSRNVISRALGAEETVDIDIKTTMVEPGTMFLLCSDGITRHIEDPELEQLFNDEIEPQALCEQMRAICYERGAEDNLTAVIVRVSGHLAGVAPAMAEPLSEDAGAPLEIEEEETVATARSPFDEPIVETAPAPEADDEAYLLEEPVEEVRQDAAADTIASVEVPAPEQAPAPVAAAAVPTSTPFSYALDDDKPASGSRAFPMILMLLLGGALGFGALWFWQMYNPAPQVPVLTDTKGGNVTMVVFEETRRLVDEDPARFLLAKTHTAQTAQDRYFIGRGLLLQNKHVEALNQFRQAQTLLLQGRATNDASQVDADNAQVLANEIAMGIAIAENQAAYEALAKEIAAANQPGTAANSNVNANTNANVNAAGPIR
jgi:serine/threonine protein phosphatase PrpC